MLARHRQSLILEDIRRAGSARVSDLTHSFHAALYTTSALLLTNALLVAFMRGLVTTPTVVSGVK